MTIFEILLLSLVFLAFILYCWTLRAAKSKPKEITPKANQKDLGEYVKEQMESPIQEKVEKEEEKKETEPEMVKDKEKKKPEKKEREKKEEEVELLS